MTDSEKKLLIALVLMNNICPSKDDEVDSLAESAGQHAIEALRTLD